MEPVTLIAFGALVISGVSVVINLYQAYRKRQRDVIDHDAAVIQAETQMRLGAVEAAQTVIDMYGEALTQLRERVKYLEKRLQDLEEENSNLRIQLNSNH